MAGETTRGKPLMLYLDVDLLKRVRELAPGASSDPERVRDLLGYLLTIIDTTRVRLPRNEALAVVDACQSWLIEPHSALHIWQEVRDAEEDGLGAKWGIDTADLVARLRDDWTSAERIVLALQVRRVLALMGDGMTPDEALRNVGLVRG